VYLRCFGVRLGSGTQLWGSSTLLLICGPGGGIGGGFGGPGGGIGSATACRVPTNGSR
jgi:hypothetical protein